MTIFCYIVFIFKYYIYFYTSHVTLTVRDKVYKKLQTVSFIRWKMADMAGKMT